MAAIAHCADNPRRQQAELSAVLSSYPAPPPRRRARERQDTAHFRPAGGRHSTIGFLTAHLGSGLPCCLLPHRLGVYELGLYRRLAGSSNRPRGRNFEAAALDERAVAGEGEPVKPS